jgi:hypothetical protein
LGSQMHADGLTVSLLDSNGVAGALLATAGSGGGWVIPSTLYSGVAYPAVPGVSLGLDLFDNKDGNGLGYRAFAVSTRTRGAPRGSQRCLWRERPAARPSHNTRTALRLRLSASDSARRAPDGLRRRQRDRHPPVPER